MARSRLAQSATGQQPGSPPLAAVLCAGVLLLLYLVTAWRAVHLNTQLASVEEELSQAKLELQRVSSALGEQLAPEINPPAGDARHRTSRPPVDEIPCGPLPPVEESPVVEMAGFEGGELLESPQVPRVARGPDD